MAGSQPDKTRESRTRVWKARCLLACFWRRGMPPASSSLFHLAQQLDRARVAASSECGHPTGGINRHGAQKLGQLACCAGIEAAIGATGRTGDGAKGVFGFAIVALLEHEGRHSE